MTVARGLSWDIRTLDVLEFETANLLKREESKLFYTDVFYERESTIGYQFSSDKLFRIRMDIHQHFTNPQDWITLLMDVQSDLQEKWGAPLSAGFVWRDEVEKNYPDNWGMAVLKGELDIVVKWADAQTLVTVKLAASEKLRPALSLLYEKRARPQHSDVPAASADESSRNLLFLP
jgi:hypothetical protein